MDNTTAQFPKGIFQNLNHPYYISAPHYQQTSGGVRALHYLCHALNLMGEEAYITTPSTHPQLRTPVLTDDISQRHVDAGRSPIVIYPEVIPDNPRGALNVVRYLLAEPALHTGVPIRLGPRDQVFTYGKTLVPEGWQADMLRIPLVDTRIYNRNGVDNRKRRGSAVFIHRHLNKGGQLHPVTQDSIEISYRVSARTAEECADIFRSVECLYLYEFSTICFEALLCGCPVIFLLNETSLPTSEPWLMDSLGISWSLDADEIARAKATVHQALNFYEEEEATFWRDLKSFVEKTQANAIPFPTQAAEVAPAAAQPGRSQKKRIAIVSAEAANGPCPHLRFTRPFSMASDSWEMLWALDNNKLDIDMLKSADLVVFQRYTPGLFSEEQLAAILKLCKKVVYDTDDLLHDVPDYHPQAAGARGWKKGIEFVARHADAVVVSTPFLKEKLLQLNSNVHVMPNFLDYDMFYRPVAAPSERPVRIGMVGTSLQGPNFALVDAALRKIVSIYPGKVQLFFIGWAPPAGWADHPAAQFHPLIHSYPDYAEVIKKMEWDIGLIPLADDEFNFSKTAIKWLEYSAAGIAGVFSDVPVYSRTVTHGETGLLAPASSEAWFDAIDSLITHPEQRVRLATQAQTQVRERFSLAGNLGTYVGLYDALLDGPAAAVKPGKRRVAVCSVESTWSPCPQIRLILPFGFMADDWELEWAIKDGQFDVSVLENADLIVLHRFTPGLLSIEGLQSLFALGKPVIYETDDLLNDIPDYHPQAADSRTWKPGIEYAIRHAHGVTVSTAFLADKYRALNSNIHVLPNYLDFDRFYRPVPGAAEEGLVTIGLLGTSITGPNFALVHEALRTLCERHAGKLKLHFVGWECPEGWEGHPAVTYEPFIHAYQDYARKLLEWKWDIALVPLVNDDFNHSKSAIKWLEYAAAGIATAFSDVSVYNGVVKDGRSGLLVEESAQAWLQAIESLVDQPALRRRVARTAQAEVRIHHALRERVSEYDRAYRSFAGLPPRAHTRPERTPAVCILDRGGIAGQRDLSQDGLFDAALAALPRVVLTTAEDNVPASSSSVHYLRFPASEFAQAIELLLARDEFDWQAVVEVE